MKKVIFEKIKEKSKKIKWSYFFYFLFFIIVITFGTFIRFYKLDQIPPGVQYDEAYNGLDGFQSWQKRNFKIFYPENFGREGLYINLIGISEGILGISNFSLRLISAIIGSLTIIGFFFLLREFFEKKWAILGTLFLATSFWHLNFSRTAYRAIFVPFIITWSSYFFFKGINKNQTKQKKIFFWFLSGIFLGLGFHTYISFRVAPFIFLILITSLFFSENKNFWSKYWKNLTFFTFGAILVALPIFIYFAKNPLDFTGRSNAVSIFNSPNYSLKEAFLLSLSAHLGSFFFIGDPNQRHNHNLQPLLPPVWSILFFLGFLISIKEIFQFFYQSISKKRKNYSNILKVSLLAQATFWIMLIPGVLSIEGIPHSLRIIGTIPAVFILLILPFHYFEKIIKKIKKDPQRFKLKPFRYQVLIWSIIGIIFVSTLGGLFQVFTYFEIWGKDPRTKQAFEKELFDLGKIIKEIPLKEENFLIVEPQIYINKEHTETSLKTTHWSGYPKINFFKFYSTNQKTLEEIPCENSLLIFQTKDLSFIKKFQEKCPDLNLQKQTPKEGNFSFWILK